jgi:hypothetical protein
LSNLAPPSVVLALYGAGQILLLAGVWDLLNRLLRRDRLWVPIALIGVRGMGMYLWHIPLVGVAAATVIATGWSQPPLSAKWWLVHVAVAVTVVPTAWFVAGLVEPAQRRLSRWRGLVSAPALGCALGGVAVLNMSATGFATLTGAGAVGLPSSAILNLALVVLAFGLVGSGSPERSAQ